MWKRAGINTLRCLLGCTSGDFSAMWYLQSFHADFELPTIMILSSMCSRFQELLNDLLKHFSDIRHCDLITPRDYFAPAGS